MNVKLLLDSEIVLTRLGRLPQYVRVNPDHVAAVEDYDKVVTNNETGNLVAFALVVMCNGDRYLVRGDADEVSTALLGPLVNGDAEDGS